MCFSAGVVISAIGVATVIKVRKPSYKLFTVMPLIFGIQLSAEGLLWLTLQNPDHLTIQKISMYIFLITEDVLWLVMIPGSLFISGVKGMRWLGILMFLAVVVTVIFYVKNVTSVWCFFAAIISVLIYRLVAVSKDTGSMELSI
jgi:hypothetical protein